MGFFSGAKNNFKKAEAAVIVQNLLEHQVNVPLSGATFDPAKIANALVGDVWDNKPDIFSGKFSTRPNKLAIAACALGLGVKFYDDRKDVENRLALMTALGNLLSEIEVNGPLYGLNSVDVVLIASASEVLEEVTNPFMDILDQMNDYPTAAPIV